MDKIMGSRYGTLFQKSVSMQLISHRYADRLPWMVPDHACP
jgi:hypothetical protein